MTWQIGNHYRFDIGKIDPLLEDDWTDSVDDDNDLAITLAAAFRNVLNKLITVLLEIKVVAVTTDTYKTLAND